MGTGISKSFFLRWVIILKASSHYRKYIKKEEWTSLYKVLCSIAIQYSMHYLKYRRRNGVGHHWKGLCSAAWLPLQSLALPNLHWRKDKEHSHWYNCSYVSFQIVSFRSSTSGWAGDLEYSANLSTGAATIINIVIRVADLWNFGTDPDPRIPTSY